MLSYGGNHLADNFEFLMDGWIFFIRRLKIDAVVFVTKCLYRCLIAHERNDYVTVFCEYLRFEWSVPWTILTDTSDCGPASALRSTVQARSRP